MNPLLTFLRFVLFCVFFAVGAGAIVLALQIEREITDYYQSKTQLEKIIQDNEKLKSLISQYQAQIALIEREPNILGRLEQITLGQAPTAEDTVYPNSYNPKLAKTVQQVLEQTEGKEQAEPMPDWLQRCRQPKYRKSLLIAGCGLVLVGFIFFGNGRRVKPEAKKFYTR